MEFGLEKCATGSFKKGKLVSTRNIVTQELDQEVVYKFLGVDESDGPSTLQSEREDQERIQ